MDNNWNLQSIDYSINTKAGEIQGIAFAITALKTMWGLAMFGRVSILGAGYYSTFTDGSLNISYSQATLNVVGS